MLGIALQKHGFQTHHAEADAVVLIVQTAIDCSSVSDTILIGDDTDLLVQLCHNMKASNQHNIYFKPEPKATKEKISKRKKNRIWNMKRTIAKLGKSTCTNLLFLHAFLGCDSTSRFFGVSKSQTMKLLSYKTVQTAAAVIEEIYDSGEKAIVTLYSKTAALTKSLNCLRYEKFCQRVASATKAVDAKCLPPTSNVTKFHLMRAYCQMQVWKGIGMDPRNLGWTETNGKFIPMKQIFQQHLHHCWIGRK